MWVPVTGLVCLAVAGPVTAVPSILEPVRDGVYVVRDDSGQWGGHISLSITHQCAAPYQARKILDLTDVPAELWDQVIEVRVSIHFMVRDFSFHDKPVANGLDEAFEVVVNGEVNRFPTDCGAPVYNETGPPSIAWFDIRLPKHQFLRGVNELILRKAPSDKNDDYLYLGIDHSQQRGNSYVTFDGGPWRQDLLTVPGGNGEYMIRLYLLTRTTSTQATWRPGKTPALEDPDGLVLYAGSASGQKTEDGLQLAAGQNARVEWEARALDRLEPIAVSVDGLGDAELAWLDEGGKPTGATRVALPARLGVPADTARLASGLQIAAADRPVTVTRVTLSAGVGLHPCPARIDMCPAIAEPRGARQVREPQCAIGPDSIVLSNAGLRCRFEHGERLRLTSLYNELTASEMLRDPQAAWLFLVEVQGQRYAGSRDFTCRGVRANGATGFAADLELIQPALAAELRVSINEEGLRLGLAFHNRGTGPLDFKLAFPHLAGLAVSDDPRHDYYFFPWGGGIIADRPALIRNGYGDHEALYQVIDLFSPQLGGGLYVRTDDAEGWHKTLALRKHIPGTVEEGAQRAHVVTALEYQWTNPLEAVPGIGLAYEYLRRTRPPGGSFAPADAVLATHSGDWRQAMRAYSDWAHRVWRFRPYPSRLKRVHHMIAVGWGNDFLFRDGRYRTDFITPVTDCVELMSWWDWSPLGPWGTPFDRLTEVLSEAQIKMWQPYFVKDPVTGETMWNNQPNDYTGYNERFGGLPAFRAAVETYQKMGALVTLYTDPFRLDDNCPLGRDKAREWGVVLADGEHSKAYEVWNPCHDTPQVREWVAQTMGRVMRETGADGIRLDEYGHRGWACFSTLHPHTYSEPGVTQWQKAVAETTRMVHEAIDAVRPDLVLTTEHPGYDFLMQYLEGCITYDLTVQASPLRPLECNLQRFFFPECKPYELDHLGADPDFKKRMWNAVDPFGRYLPPAMYAALRDNEEVYASRDCEPLIPTLKPFVYANRFSGAAKTIYHLYNASGHTVDGNLLLVPMTPDQHLVDLLANSEVATTATDAGHLVAATMPRDGLLCLAVLPRRLTVVRRGDSVAVTVNGSTEDARLVVCDGRAETLLTVPAVEGLNQLDLQTVRPDHAPVAVKLMDGREMVDVAAIHAD